MKINPKTAAHIDVTKMTALPKLIYCSICSGGIPDGRKANPSTNIAMVKPIPAITPIDNNCFHVALFGSTAIFSFTASQLDRKIPIGLPINSPKNIPGTIGGIGIENNDVSNTTPALAKANRGIIKKFVTGLKNDSNLCNIGLTLRVITFIA